MSACSQRSGCLWVSGADQMITACNADRVEMAAIAFSQTYFPKITGHSLTEAVLLSHPESRAKTRGK